MSNKLYEFTSFDRAHMVVEGLNGNGKELCMKGVFIQGDVRNQNQRVYPFNEIGNAVKTVNEKISGGETLLGELDHPEELSINLDRVSHIITEMWMDGADGHGTLKIVGTPMGEIVKTLLQSHVKLGVSSRGSGNVDDDGSVSEFEIVTVDIVAQPSAPNAYPTTIYESLFNMKGGSQVYTMAEAVVNNDPIAKKHIQKDILRFITELRI